MNVVFAGGGTAGHINPAVAIALKILKEDSNSKILFVGNAHSMEEEISLKNGFLFKSIKVSGFQRKINASFLKNNMKSLYYAFNSNSKCKKIFKEFKPDIVIGTGGYVSGPVLYTASKMNIKTLIHEQNSFPGITTKILSKYVDKILLNNDKAKTFIKQKEKCIVTGIPVRDSILSVSRKKARQHFKINDKICVLSFGGSLGARPLNDAILDLLVYEQKKNLNTFHIHATGKGEYDFFLKKAKENNIDLKNDRFLILPYIYNMDFCLTSADLVISRSGATTLSEVSALTKASILIPSPYVSENHQYHNAKAYEEKNACVLITEPQLKEGKLIQKVDELIANKSALDELCDNISQFCILDANERIYKIIKEII